MKFLFCVTSCSLSGGYQRFGVAYRSHLQNKVVIWGGDGLLFAGVVPVTSALFTNHLLRRFAFRGLYSAFFSPNFLSIPFRSLSRTHPLNTHPESFDLEHGSNTFLRNVCNHLQCYVALQLPTPQRTVIYLVIQLIIQPHTYQFIIQPFT